MLSGAEQFPIELRVRLNEYRRHLPIFCLWDISREDLIIHFSTIQTIDYYFRIFNYQFSVVAYLATVLRIMSPVSIYPSMFVITVCMCLRHRKCGVRDYIYELFVSRPERVRYERLRAFDTNNS